MYDAKVCTPRSPVTFACLPRIGESLATIRANFALFVAIRGWLREPDCLLPWPLSYHSLARFRAGPSAHHRKRLLARGCPRPVPHYGRRRRRPRASRCLPCVRTLVDVEPESQTLLSCRTSYSRPSSYRQDKHDGQFLSYRSRFPSCRLARLTQSGSTMTTRGLIVMCDATIDGCRNASHGATVMRGQRPDFRSLSEE